MSIANRQKYNQSLSAKPIHARKKRNANSIDPSQWQRPGGSPLICRTLSEHTPPLRLSVSSFGLDEERSGADPLPALICMGASISSVPIVDNMEFFSVVQELSARDANRTEASGGRRSRYLHWCEELAARCAVESDDIRCALTPTIFSGTAGNSTQSGRTPCSAPLSPNIQDVEMPLDHMLA